DLTGLDKYTVIVTEDAAYNTPGGKSNLPGFLVTALRSRPRTPDQLADRQNEPTLQQTQLRSIFREITGITALKANDRVQLTIGPRTGDDQPRLLERLFLSPIFSTDD